jgi:hypothetical protein
MNSHRPAAALILAASSVAVSQSTPPSQQALNSSCANIVAMAGAKVDCSNLTEVQRKAIANLPAIMKMALEDQNYFKEILDKLNILLSTLTPTTGSITQANSGGFNVLQGTTGNNSPIVNSPITVGALPKTIAPNDMSTVVAFLTTAGAKSALRISADQTSSAQPFPDDFYQAFKDSGWTMKDAGTNHIMGFSPPGKLFKGAVVTVKGTPLGPGETIHTGVDDPLFYVGKVLKTFNVGVDLIRSPTAEDGLISVHFEGGFDN